MSTLEELARQFDADRSRLRSVAFHILGSGTDADDAVQSAWLKASRADYRAVANPTGWFTTITARSALDQLRVRRRRAEASLPEPAELDHRPQWASPPADEELVQAEAISRALLVVLDRLSPAQRVAFVLHDIFGVPFEAIAEVLARSVDSAKKLASRARTRLRGAPTDTPPPTAEHIEIVQAFLAASQGGDIPALLTLLAPGVVRHVDANLVPGDVARQVHGARNVAEETRRFTRRARTGAVLLIDGAPGIVLAPGGHLQALLRLTIGGDSRIHRVDIIGAADRIAAAVLTLIE